MTDWPRIAVIVHRLGPYHVARLNALAWPSDLCCVETVAMDRTYGWGRVDEAGLKFRRFTLFDDEDRARDADRLRSAVRDALHAFGPNTVAVPGWGDAAGLFALEWATTRPDRTRRRILMSDSQAHDAPRRPHAEWIKRRVVAFADAGLVAGRTHADYLAALGMPRDRIATGYDVVDNAHFAGPPGGTRDKTFLVVARFVPKKNLLALVRAHGRYADARRGAGGSPWRLILVGEGPERAALAEAAAASSGEVEIRPFAAYTDLPALYARAGALVLPSTVEQWGLVVNEAMAAGCPVVVTERAGVAAELVEDGVTGHLTAPDEASLAVALARMQDADRAALSRAAAARIADWGPERFAHGMLEARTAARRGRRTVWPVRMLGLLARRVI